MKKAITKIIAAFMFLGPVTIGLAQVPAIIDDALPVYSAPSDIDYSRHPAGMSLAFKVTKKHACVLPKNKADQDVFASISYTTEDGSNGVLAADTYPADDPSRPFKNVLLINVPTVVGPFVVEVPSRIMPRMTEINLNVACHRPMIGNTYAVVGPFPIPPELFAAVP